MPGKPFLSHSGNILMNIEFIGRYLIEILKIFNRIKNILDIKYIIS